MPGLDPCCQQEADKILRRHRAVAVCDGCGRLLLAYGNEVDYERTLEELTDLEVDFTTGEANKLRIVAKER